tara:strand:+ start:174 stop:347 length:174 start_codon:yes stop_codon:yes gene_type:complete
MTEDLNSFDSFVDDIITSDENLLKGELDLLLMQYLFNSFDLNEIEKVLETNIDCIAA